MRVSILSAAASRLARKASSFGVGASAQAPAEAGTACSKSKLQCPRLKEYLDVPLDETLLRPPGDECCGARDPCSAARRGRPRLAGCRRWWSATSPVAAARRGLGAQRLRAASPDPRLSDSTELPEVPGRQ